MWCIQRLLYIQYMESAIGMITLGCVCEIIFSWIKCRLSICMFIYLLLGEKRWQICIIEICCCKPKGTALFNGSMCGIIFAGSHSGNPF